MKAEEVLQWVRIGTELITILGVPVVKVVQMFRDQAAPTEAILALAEQQWMMNEAHAKSRLRELGQG